MTTYRKPTRLAFGITLHNTVAYHAVVIYMTSWLSTAVKLPRSTALSIGYNIPVAIFGGFPAFIATWLIQATGSILAPVTYVIAAALGTLLTMLLVRETAFEALG